MKKCGHRQLATTGGCSQRRGSTLRFPWPPAPSQLHLTTCPSAATYRDTRTGVVVTGEELRRGIEIGAFSPDEGGWDAKLWHFVKE